MGAARSRSRCVLLPGVPRNGARCLLQETPDLRLSAWVLEGWSRLEPVQRWFEHGAAPSAKAVKASIKREKMLRSKLKVPIASTTHPHGSILLVTHGAFWRLWRAGQADGGEDAAKAEVLQHVVEGAGLVIMDEAHCIRNANTYVCCPPLLCSVAALNLDHLSPRRAHTNQAGAVTPLRAMHVAMRKPDVLDHHASCQAWQTSLPPECSCMLLAGLVDWQGARAHTRELATCSSDMMWHRHDAACTCQAGAATSVWAVRSWQSRWRRSALRGESR